jgi:formamidopyrimidine-DNA glycosylase
MSIELPEARILAQQLDASLMGKTIKSYDLRDVERMMQIGFVNKNLSDFETLKDKMVKSAKSRGNTIRVQLTDSMNLLIAPEYGGVVTYLPEGGKSPKYHLKLEFTDGSILTTRITSMGVIKAVHDQELSENYMYKRDFIGGVSPDEPDFTWEWFKYTFGSENRQLKPLLVGKDAHIIGVSNATFQDVIYRAGIHPKRKATDLSEIQLKALYDAIKTVIDERLKKNGKHRFKDINGIQGAYIPAMGPNMKDQKCPRCGTAIQKIAHGGGSVYLCPSCQSESG